MACYHPLTAYRGPKGKSGKNSVVFDPSRASTTEKILVPCGQCIGCRMEYSRQWAIRCVHEASLYDENCFLTLTYDDEHLPKNESLVKEDFQLFMKRLRKNNPDSKIRFLMCGEYGTEKKRPHYHACIFNFNFKDRVVWSRKKDVTLYVSEELNKTWKKGYCIIGNVTFQSARYITDYIIPKFKSDPIRTKEYYGEKVPEYLTMSRGGRTNNGENLGGIGKPWLRKFKTDVYPSDEVEINGQEVKPPKYYDSVIEKEDEEMFKKIKQRRQEDMKYDYSNIDFFSGAPLFTMGNSKERLKVKEEIKIRNRINQARNI